MASLVVRVSRDSVHPGDDLESHATSVALPADATVGEFLRDIVRNGYLPTIAGGDATWLIDAGGTCIGVWAQQWPEPRLTIDAATRMSELADDAAFHFRYWCQADPGRVFMNVMLTLSEPWEMGEALGWPAVRAVVLYRSPQAWLVEVLEPFRYEEMEYRYLVVTARHSTEPLPEAMQQPVPCNMIRTSAERIASKNPCDLSWWRGGGSMIGSIAPGSER